MKKARENEEDIEYTKSELTITRSKRLLDGTLVEIDAIDYETPSECDFEYSLIEGEEMSAPWPIQTRKGASQLGQRKYYTGTLCKHNHMSQRYVCSGLCIACVSAKSKRFKTDTAAARKGLKPVTIMIHPDDAQAIEEYATTLTTLRGL